MSYREISKGVVKRTKRRELGLFIDGTGLDRATRRISRKVDMPKLVRGVTAGVVPTVARYYTLIPYEDDSRQRAFLDAVRRADLRVIVKRLPPKGINRMVSVEVEMAADIIAFALGHKNFSSLSEYLPESSEKAEPYKSPGHAARFGPGKLGIGSSGTGSKSKLSEKESRAANIPSSTASLKDQEQDEGAIEGGLPANIQRIVTVVCPDRNLTYPISLVNELGVDTVTADFGQFNHQDVLKSAAKWIDLSDSETIWRD